MVVLVSLTLLRIQIVQDMGMTYAEAMQAHFMAGIFRDAVSLMWLPVMANIFTALRIPPVATWTVFAWLTWTAALANALYFKFFEIRLDLWVVQMHWRDIAEVKGSATGLGNTPFIIISALVLLVAAVIQIMWRGDRPYVVRRGLITQIPWRRYVHRFSPALVCLCLVVAGIQFPKVIGPNPSSTIINDSIFRWWWRQTKPRVELKSPNPNWRADLVKASAQMDVEKSREELAVFRTMENKSGFELPGALLPKVSAPVEAVADNPLVATIQPEPEFAAALGKHLGLTGDRPPNVLFLFLESVRSYEIMHPEIGPLLFPNLRKVLEENSLFFTQAYSSSLNAGQTVRAQFSTQCSMLPNIGGAATYIAHTNLRTLCLPSVLKQHGYRNVWINSFRADFHRKRTFEMLHGMDDFYDQAHFDKIGVTEGIGDWGLADGPFLLETINILEKINRGPEPFYANVLTISTHHPFSVVPEGPIPPALAQRYADRKSYLGYLSRLKYLDISLGKFFERYFQSDLVDNTLLFLLGDHSVAVLPNKNVSPEVWTEIRFRIPLAIVSPKIKAPHRIERPVHQVDLAPTVLRALGVGADVPWVGRGLFAPQAAPWVFVSNGAVSYRRSGKACYSRWKGDDVYCRMTDGVDPLFAEELAPLEADAEVTKLFSELVQANLRLIAFNELMSKQTREKLGLRQP
jgi:arylsulfatase A-like enzyme